MRVASVIGFGLAAVLVTASTPGAFAPQDTDCRDNRRSDAFEVQTSVGPPSVVFPGGFGNGAFSIDNHSSIAASVEFSVFIEFADGTIQPLTGLGSPVTLGPGQGIVQFITFIVPPNAATGQAIFTCRACATFQGVPPSRASGIDQSTFTVQ